MAITTEQIVLKKNDQTSLEQFNMADHQLILAFGSRYTFEDENFAKLLIPSSPNQHLIMCSTSGQIANTLVYDDELILTGISFEHTDLKIAKTNITSANGSYTAGQQLAKELLGDKLMHVLIFSDGHIVNGDELVSGLNNVLPDNITFTGGMAGDAIRFECTLVSHNEIPVLGNIVALGLYSDKLQIAYASSGGFDAFGPYRKVTKSKNNVLYELDNKNALSLYKTYLGDLAAKLPGSALFFPLSILLPNNEDVCLVRTILSVDETNNSMTFAGDIPEGSKVRLMRSNIEHVVDAAEIAAESCFESHNNTSPELVLLISCVGRKLILNQRVEEETEAVKNVLGNSTITGFYSYGEICPSSNGKNIYANLHNQTMTITTFTEL